MTDQPSTQADKDAATIARLRRLLADEAAASNRLAAKNESQEWGQVEANAFIAAVTEAHARHLQTGDYARFGMDVQDILRAFGDRGLRSDD